MADGGIQPDCRDVPHLCGQTRRRLRVQADDAHWLLVVRPLIGRLRTRRLLRLHAVRLRTGVPGY